MSTTERIYPGFVRAEKSNISPVGSGRVFFGSSDPIGYFICDGRAVSRTTYADLFAIISTIYGIGDGSTTFNIPDLRGRFPRGRDDGSGPDGDGSRTLGSTQTDGTRRTNTWTTNSAGGHNNHRWEGPWSNSDGNNGVVSILNAFSTNPARMGSIGTLTGAGGSHLDHGQTGGDAETRPINLAINYIIKY